MNIKTEGWKVTFRKVALEPKKAFIISTETFYVTSDIEDVKETILNHLKLSEDMTIRILKIKYVTNIPIVL